MSTKTSLIRNFSIIAHIDHGKSTLADQFLLKTGTITQRDFQAQLLDAMDLERERGITIRMHPVTIYHTLNGVKYELNLIDTPGHVDFGYEVSRSLAACEGVILLVDAFQGVQAQTVANAYLAMESNLKIVPVLNKIDLQVTRIDAILAEMETALGIDPFTVLRASGKAGLGIEEVLQAIVERVPPPPGKPENPLQALVYNSHFDSYRGVVIYIRVMEGRITKGQKIKLMRMGTEHDVMDVGQFRPGMVACTDLVAGQVGYVVAQIKTLSDVHIGDTVTDAERPTAEALPGYKEPKAMVFSGLYPVNNHEFEALREALGKLKLNDSSFTYQPENSEGLGFGFRCGFLGMLHREIIQQRVERDSGLDLVVTAPNVTYEILTRSGEIISIDNPQKVPEGGQVEEFREPIVKASFLVPTPNIGDIMKLCTERRGIFIRTEYLSPTRAIIVYELPLAEVIYDLYDKLKSVTHGYGTMDYDILGFRPADLVRLDILVHGRRVDATCSIIVHRAFADCTRPQAGEEAAHEKVDRQHVRDRHPGRDRQPHHRPRDHLGHEEGRDREVLRRRHHAAGQAYWSKQAAGKKPHEAGGPGWSIPQEAFLAVLESDQ